MTARILTPTETCCEPTDLEFHEGQHAKCERGRAWTTVLAVDNALGIDNWFIKWAPLSAGEERIA